MNIIFARLTYILIQSVYISAISIHWKLWVAVATHNFKWVKILFPSYNTIFTIQGLRERHTRVPDGSVWCSWTAWVIQTFIIILTYIFSFYPRKIVMCHYKYSIVINQMSCSLLSCINCTLDSQINSCLLANKILFLKFISPSIG